MNNGEELRKQQNYEEEKKGFLRAGIYGGLTIAAAAIMKTILNADSSSTSEEVLEDKWKDDDK